MSDVCSVGGALQIRRSSSHCLVKVADLRRLLNVSYVQTYMINGEPGVFLDKRALSGKAKKPAANKCTECNRGLNDADCLFCSLGCKVIKSRPLPLRSDQILCIAEQVVNCYAGLVGDWNVASAISTCYMFLKNYRAISYYEMAVLQ